MAEKSIIQCLQGLSPCVKGNVSLRPKQSLFALLVALLIQRAYELGYELSFGDAWAREGHMDRSLHYIRLAIDLNLFKDGKYIHSVTAHKPLGEYWESLGGSWGGRFGDAINNSIS